MSISVNLTDIAKIERVLMDMEQGRCDKQLLEECPELVEKMQEQEKLKYRLEILKRQASKVGAPINHDNNKKKYYIPSETGTFQSESNNPAENVKYICVEDYGDSIIEKLNNVFDTAISKEYPEFNIKVNIKETNNPRHGDYQFDACMQISRQITTDERIVTSQEVAKKIMEHLDKIPLVEKYEIANLSNRCDSQCVYINVFLNKQHLGKKIADLCTKGLTTPRIAKKHVIVDYSSPNIAKQMHVGHLRSTIIGESISRLLEYAGFSVTRLNHIGDWGTQFGMLIAYLRECFPNYLKEPPQIEDLQTFYKESKIKFDEDPNFKVQAYQCVVKLQNFEKDIVDAWQLICDISRKDFANLYQRLDVNNLNERGESFYQSRMQLLVKELGDNGKLTEDDGRKLMFVNGCSIPLTIVKSDGGYTYDTSDLAALKQRIFEEKADWILYVVDRGQSVHLETVYKAAQSLGWYDLTQKRVEHVQFGLVLGEDRKKFKTRSGDTVKLQDLLDEGVKRAEEKLRSKENTKEFSPEELKATAEALAYGCIKYSDLAQSRIADYVFSFDRMLDDRGNTAVYLMYAYTRIRSIARNAQITRQQIGDYLAGLKNGIVPLDHPREIRLAKQVLKFNDYFLNVLESLQLNKICDYVYELATIFHDFYKECYVVTKVPNKNKDQSGSFTTKINFNRLVLCEVTADVIQSCFHILGIRPIDRM